MLSLSYQGPLFKCSSVSYYPTGQNYSLELIFAKFASAKNREK